MTNGVASSQRVIDDIIKRKDLNGTYAYIDNVTICGQNQAEHDLNLKKFMNSVVKYGLTLNKNKCLYSLPSIDFFGYTISKGSVKPDPDRLKGLMDLPVPTKSSFSSTSYGDVLSLFSVDPELFRKTTSPNQS